MEVDSFVAEIVPRIRDAQAALYAGDPAPWTRLWSPDGDVSWLGQFGTSAVGREEVGAHFARVAAREWEFEGFDLSVVAVHVDGDHAYLVTRERPRLRLGDGVPPLLEARVSRVLRRQNGTWYVAHGHADLDPLALDLPWKPPGRSARPLASSETEAFLTAMVPAQSAADTEIHNGDPGPRIALWSHRDPVSLFGANLTVTGWSNVEPAFHEVASWFDGSMSWDFQIVHAQASGDLAYTVAYENSAAVTDGVPRSYRLRVTHLYRREGGVWKIIHRHADFEPDASTPLFDDRAEPASTP